MTKPPTFHNQSPVRRKRQRWAIGTLLAGVVVIAVVSLHAVWGAASRPGATSTAASANTLVLRSPVVSVGGTLPEDFTGDGAGITPPLEWSGAPAGTKSYAMIMHHTDVEGVTYSYWIVYNIPADVQSLPRDMRGIGTLGLSSRGNHVGYTPPHSAGPGLKTYVFTLYALSAAPQLNVPPSEVGRETLLEAMKDITLCSADLRVNYTRISQAAAGQGGQAEAGWGGANLPQRPGPPQDRGGEAGRGGPRGNGPPGRGPRGGDRNGIPPPLSAEGASASGVWIPLTLAGLAAILGLLPGSRLRLPSWARRPWVRWTLLLVIIGGHFGFLMLHFAPTIGTPDASGYFVQARLIATEGHTWFARESPLQYVNHHWLSTDGDRYFSQYPPGLAVLCAGIFWLAGPTAALLVNPVLASLTLLGLFLLCRVWMGAGWGVLAALLMAFNPITNEHALSADSHTAVAFLLVWGLYVLALWSQRRSLLLALLAGLLLGIIPTIRYPEGLFLIAAGMFMALTAFRERKCWWSLGAMIAGALLPIIALLVRNHLAFGSMWKTGYTLTNEQSNFAWAALVNKAMPYVTGILGVGTGFVAALGLVAMMALIVRRATWRQGLLLLSLVVPVTVLYMAYGLPEASLRFLIPTFTVYILAATWGLKLLADFKPRLAIALAAACAVGTACWGLPQSEASLARLQQENSDLALITRAVLEHVPPGSLLIADPRIQQQLDYIGQWKLVDESLLSGVNPDDRGGPPNRNRGPGGPNGPQRPGAGGPRAVHEQERRQILARYSDRQGREASGRMLEDLDAWRGQEKVYWIGDAALMRQLLPPSDQLQKVATIKMSDQFPRRSALGGGPGTGAPLHPPQDDAAHAGPGGRSAMQEIAVALWIRSDAHQVTHDQDP